MPVHSFHELWKVRGYALAFEIKCFRSGGAHSLVKRNLWGAEQCLAGQKQMPDTQFVWCGGGRSV